MKKAPMVVQDYEYNNNVVDILLSGYQVALIGHAGVGKSTQLNIFLVDLFRVLMAGTIKDLFHRVKRELYRYHSTQMDGVKTIVCAKVEGVGRSYLNAF